MTEQQHPTRNTANTGRMWAGIIIVGIGAILLAGRLGLDWLFPHWIFNWRNMWPMMLIVVGLIIGGNSNFKNPASYILLCIGSFFLLRNITHIDLGAFVWPVIIIGIGLWLLLANGKRGAAMPPPDNLHRYHKRSAQYEWDKRVSAAADDTATGEAGPPENGSNGFSSDDYVKSTAVFSEVRKTVISKRFRGGEIVNIFGGTDINLIQADIHHPIVIDVFQLFAGTKIIVPAHWKIQSEVVSVFGEVDDRRFTQGVPHDEQKVVYIKGTSIFGGITIKNM